MFMTGTTRVGGKAALLKVIRNLGYNPEPVFADAGLNIALLADPDFFVPTAAFGKLFAQCVKSTGCAHIGLLVGAEANLSWLGRVGFIVKNSDNVGLALESLGSHFHHHDSYATVALKILDNIALLTYSPMFVMDGQDQWLIGVLSCGVKLIRELCGMSWAPNEVRLTIKRPADTRFLESFFRSNLIFEASENALVFDTSLLARPVDGAQPELRRLLSKDIDRTEYCAPVDFASNVTRIVRTHIGTDQCSELKICAVLGLSPRAFHNRLQAHGTTYSKILGDARFELAKQLMQHTPMSLHKISARLGYSEISAFSRAFTRWAGAPPSDWRLQNQV